MEGKPHWNPQLYDTHSRFVSEYGQSLIELLQPQPGERILDVGCGTGDLANQIAQAKADVEGIDASPEMIAQAQQKYPHLTFRVADIAQFRTAHTYDAVFSNAVLHWVKEADKALESIWLALRPGGRFVAELGGQGNIAQVEKAILQVLHEEYSLDASSRSPWYFPSLGTYTRLMEQQGFVVRYALYFDRPTPLPDGEKGLQHWLDNFAASFFVDFLPSERQQIYRRIEDLLKPKLFDGQRWVGDYKRLRILAHKPIS